jgi:glycosyltransferase involved in cell wall biosynthesis
MSDVTVSIITASYNSAETIRDTIESVLNQTVPCREYFIIDGKSQDDTVAIAESYGSAFADKGIRYEVCSEPDHGIYDAMNKGIRKATGTLVGMINSDDWYEKNAVETVLGAYEKTPFDMIYADLRMWKNGQPLGIKHARQRKHYVTTRDWNHPTTFIRKSCYQEYLYRNLCTCDDLDMWLHLIHEGKKIITVNETLANYRLGGESNKKTLAKALQRAREKYACYRSNGFSRMYFFEAYGMELAKLILA